jgi:alcohol dehydrogenase (cytochrome c)
MIFLRTAFFLAVSALILIAIAVPGAMAQRADEQTLVHPPADSWPGYHGDYSGRRHSPLTQITPQNVKNLSLAWAFQTDQLAPIKSSPLMVDGILYFTVPENIWAVDARSGHQIWHYTHPRTPGEHIGHRGVGMYKGYLFFLTPDAHLVSLNAKDGSVRWNVEVADVTKGYWTSMAPLIIGNRVLVGVSGDFDNRSGSGIPLPRLAPRTRPRAG